MFQLGLEQHSPKLYFCNFSIAYSFMHLIALELWLPPHTYGPTVPTPDAHVSAETPTDLGFKILDSYS